MANKTLNAIIYIAACLVLTSAAAQAKSADSGLLHEIGTGVSDCSQTVNSEACGYGKRFYSLSQYSTEPNTDALYLCYSACNDSYTIPDHKTACESGCQLEVAAEKNRQSKLSDYEKNGEALVQQARLNQMWAHWMFEMMTGFDVFNDWYSTCDYDTVDDSQSYASTYVVIQQSDDVVSISTYQKVGGGQKNAKEGNVLTSWDTQMLPISSQEQTYKNTVNTQDAIQSRLEDDADSEDFYFMTYYTWYLLCLLLICSSLTLIWLMCCVVTSKRRVAKRPKGTVEEKKDVIMLDFSVCDSKPAAIHKNADDVPMLTA